MRLVFAGTPETALPSLRALLASGHDVVAVLTRPDAAAGRGRRIRPSPVAQEAAGAGVEVLRPGRLSEPEFLERLRQIAPDCCPVVAYGALVPQAALDVPRFGWVNLHFSLLPAWRGAAPVQRALIAGDDVTGATTFRLVRELDAGPVFGTLTETVRPDDTSGSLLARLAEHGAGLLVSTLDGIDAGRLEARPQPSDGISLAPKLTVGECQIDWGLPAVAIGRLARACAPTPGAWTTVFGERLKIGPVAFAAAADADGDGDGGFAPGELAVTRHEVFVGTRTLPVRLGNVQPAGKPRMAASDWARGLRSVPDRLGG